MKALLVVKVQPRPNARLGCGDRRIGVQVYVFVFQASPKPLNLLPLEPLKKDSS
jgi:hypothetical protein